MHSATLHRLLLTQRINAMNQQQRKHGASRREASGIRSALLKSLFQISAIVIGIVVLASAPSPAHAQCGWPWFGDCCIPHASPNCSDEACCDTVCSLDPNCCSDSWNSQCAFLAQIHCGTCGLPDYTCGSMDTGDCCSVSSNPSCNDASCCQMVCDQLPHCCSTEWDGSCATAAEEMCGVCNPIHVPGDYAIIQAAINNANNGDTIELAPGTYHEAIDLQGKAIRIRGGEGAENTIIDASGLGTSAVTATSGEGSSTILEGVTMTGGTGTHMTLAQTDHYRGGGLYAESSTMQVINCIFIGNHLPMTYNARGGGIYADNSNMTIIGCHFEDNRAGRGGGLFVKQSSPDIQDCTFINNKASSHGGGVLFQQSGSTISNCTFADNVTYGNGGAIKNWWGSSTTTVHCEFVSNSAQNGGAIANANTNIIDIANSTFEANVATEEGGAIRGSTSGASHTAIGSCTFCENVSGTGNVIDKPWEDLWWNDFSDLCDYPHLIVVPEDVASIQDAIDMASDGTEIRVQPGTYVESIDFKGKSIYLSSEAGPEETILDGEYELAPLVSAVSGEGPDTIMEGFTVRRALAEPGDPHGGGMVIEASSPTIRECHFIDNSSVTGGGVRNVNATPTFVDCLFEANIAVFEGAAMLNTSSSQPTIIGCTFRNNSSQSGGAAIGNWSSSPVIEESIFEHNVSGSGGSALHSTQSSQPSVTGTIFEGNVSEDEEGACIVTANMGLTSIQESSFCQNAPVVLSGPWDDLDGNAFHSPGDLNCDGVVSVADLLIVLDNWGECPGGTSGCEGDANHDGLVNVEDLLIILDHWG